MKSKTEKTYWVKIYMSGPIEVAKQVLRERCMAIGLCVTIEPTLFIYTGGEEFGYVVGIINYPRFPDEQSDILDKATGLAHSLMNATHQHSSLVMSPEETTWITSREDKQ